MSIGKTRAVTPHEAAEVLFGTPHPSHEQLRLVYARMKSGSLRLNDPNCPPARWTTNERALAEFLAANQVGKHARPHGNAGTPAATAKIPHLGLSPRRQSEVECTSIYRGMWRDYFLAVMLRRRATHRSRAFQRAVGAAQAVLLTLIVALLYLTVNGMKVTVPAEHQAIAKLLASTHVWHHIDRWHDPFTDTKDRQIIRVQYRYRDADSPRVVHTDRTFWVTDDQVKELSLE